MKSILHDSPSVNIMKRMFALVALPFALILCAGLSGCSTTGSGGPVVRRLTQRHFPPTQTVDVLNALPQQPFIRIARLQAKDPTGSATRSQLIAELTAEAQKLGATAIVLGTEQSSSGGGQISFSPSGGQMQSSGAEQPLALDALAIRYAH